MKAEEVMTIQGADVPDNAVVQKKKKKKKSVRVVGFASDDASKESSETEGSIHQVLCVTLPPPHQHGGESDLTGSAPSPPTSKSFSFAPSSADKTTPTKASFAFADGEQTAALGSLSAEKAALVVVKKRDPTGATSFSAGHFRRAQRLHRNLEVSVDVLKGLEEFRKAWAAVGLILLAWGIGPIILVTISFGLIPYYQDTSPAYLSNNSNSYWRSLWAWTVLAAVMACLATDVFSFMAYEIEYGIVIIEEIPLLYGKGIVGSVIGVLSIQSILFGCLPSSALLTTSHGWLAVLAAGYLGIAVVLWWEFSHHGQTNDDLNVVLGRTLRGLAVQLVAAPVLLLVVTAIHCEYHLLGGGVVGYLVSILYPLLRPGARWLVEMGLQWGGERGMLCAGSVPAILLESWHVVFLCLIAGANATSIELAVMGAVQLCLFYSDLGHTAFFGQCLQDSKIDIYQHGADAENPYRATLEEKSDKKSCCEILLRSSNSKRNNNDRLSTLSTSDKKDDTTLSGGTSLSPEIVTGSQGPESPNSEVVSTWAEDEEEILRISRTALPCVLGLLAPCTFLITAAILDAGPNRALFRSGYLWSLSSLSASQDGSSEWLASSNPGASSNSEANAFVANLICVAAFHLVCLIWTARSYSLRKRNLLGAFATLYLTQHVATFCCAGLLAFLVIMSVCFNVFGVNSPFRR